MPARPSCIEPKALQLKCLVVAAFPSVAGASAGAFLEQRQLLDASKSLIALATIRSLALTATQAMQSSSELIGSLH